MVSIRLQHILILVFSSVLLVACGDKEKDSQVSSQVIVKVGNAEISVHQLNFQLSRMGRMDEKKVKEVTPDVLKRLVNQELLKQKALEKELDRDPRILQAIEASKTEILAQAYLEQVLAGASKPTENEIDEFYKSHPELFSERRIYRLQELAIVTEPSNAEKIESGISGVTDINQIAQWLKTNNYNFSANSNLRPAEQIPLALLNRLYALKEGQYLVLKTPKTVNIVHVAGIQPASIEREKAIPLIEQFFLNQSRSKLATKTLKSLNDTIKVEWLGEFAHMHSGADSSSGTTVGTQKSAEVEDVAADDHISNGDKAVKNGALDKGLSGL